MKPSNEIDVCFSDASDTEALMDIDWATWGPNGPRFARCRMIRYDPEGLLWLGVAYGVPILADLRDSTIRMGANEWSANLSPLEEWIRL